MRFNFRRPAPAARHRQNGFSMTQRHRKLAGVFLTLLVLLVYVSLATAIYVTFLTGIDQWILLLYFAVAGLGWAIPVGLIIRWMARPD
jgi:archaellum biogenesis protein FlaJ (TadC family)